MPRATKTVLLLFFGGHLLILWTTVTRWNSGSPKNRARAKHHEVFDPGINNNETFHKISLANSDKQSNDDIYETEIDDDVKPGEASVKTILYWNAFFQADDFKFGFGQEPFLTHNCPVSSCQTTNDKSQLDVAEAVMMHMPVVKPDPPKPRPGQKFVFVQEEPNQQMSSWLLPDFQGLFNLTISYRQDSDIPTKYGYFESNPELAQDVWVDPKERPHAAVWVVSHCDTPSLRELYAAELQKYMDVHVYGACGEYSCPKNKNPECRAMYEQKYRFYLSFENSICKDYVSEKMYHALRYNIIPIVFGGANYDKVAPPHSVIDASDYPNPKDLADYLDYLTNNSTAYNEYFRWKRYGHHIETSQRLIMARAMCRLCQILHDEHYHYKDYSDISSWWVDDACDRRAVKRMMKQW